MRFGEDYPLNHIPFVSLGVLINKPPPLT
jgi:hypothetical protein